ncbi:MAG: hypothetical protein IJD45_01885 [Clostridia bacterium]|nr:hypothetical protein [Clostridia bacterium]
MTEKLYDNDSHLKEFGATVIECYEKADGYFTILDRTAFFPEGGGQPSDTGYLDDVRVYDVREKDGVIYHYTTKQLEVGKKITGTIDFERRFDFMQQHTGEHIISGIVNSLYGYNNVGFHLSETEMTMDFDGMLTRENLIEIERQANEVIYRNAKINCYYPENLKDLEYRSKLDLQSGVRIVEIEDCDSCACCAPHVNSASEIGIIKILDFAKNKGGIRIWAVCGRRALKDYNNRYFNDLEISALLCSPQNEIAAAVKKQLENIESLKYQIGGLKKRIIESFAKTYKVEGQISAVFQDGFDIKDLQSLADSLYKEYGGIRAVFSGSEGEYSFAICGDAEKLDAWFKEFKGRLTVRGGGRNGMVQGTVQNTKGEILGVINELD